ncbi:AGAP008420-PA, partial [Anopheles gambiae str. PEST]
MESTHNSAKIYLLQEDREKSFKHWPFSDDKQCSIQKMAEAGFYWHGTETEIDIAACFVCGKELDGWEESDDPWSEHRKHAPQCPFVKFGRPETHLTVMDGKCYWLNDEEKIKLTDITFALNLQCDEFVTIMMAT